MIDFALTSRSILYTTVTVDKSGRRGILSNKIIQKGLAFPGHWSGTVLSSGRGEGSGILPRRLLCRGGASVVRRDAAMNRLEDPDAKDCNEALS
jgi:hypothetical protein